MKIKVGILISYDYPYAIECVKRLYEGADQIVLAIDEKLRTWNGGTFEIDPSFFEAIEQIDTHSKIEIYRDNFYIPELSTMQNETRERNLLADRMGREQGWHIQVDSDEYFVDFPKFVNYLHTIEKAVAHKKVTIQADWITLFKKDKNGYYIVSSGKGNRVPIATNYPHYEVARAGSPAEMIHIECSHPVLHESWSRSDAEIAEKLGSWGHNTDFDTTAYLEFWRSVTPYNAPFIKDFHPLPWQREAWHALEFVAGELDDLIHTYEKAWNDQAMAALDKRSLKKAMRSRNIAYRGLRFIYRKLKR